MRILKTELSLYDTYVKVPYSNSHGFETTYNSDGMVLLNNSDCLIEERFAQAYATSLKVGDWRGLDGSKMDMRWRFYIVLHFAESVKGLKGDFVECGVYKGGYSSAICKYLDFGTLDKTFYLFDTFNGLDHQLVNPEEEEGDLLTIYSGYDDVVMESIENTFKDYPVKIVRGSVPDSLETVSIESIAYLSIDMNMVAPEIAAANFFWDRISPGGVMILDDYGFHAHRQQKIAFDKFAKEKGVAILSLPTGQGIITKPFL